MRNPISNGSYKKKSFIPSNGGLVDGNLANEKLVSDDSARGENMNSKSLIPGIPDVVTGVAGLVVGAGGLSVGGYLLNKKLGLSEKINILRCINSVQFKCYGEEKLGFWEFKLAGGNYLIVTFGIVYQFSGSWSTDMFNFVVSNSERGDLNVYLNKMIKSIEDRVDYGIPLFSFVTPLQKSWEGNIKQFVEKFSENEEVIKEKCEVYYISGSFPVEQEFESNYFFEARLGALCKYFGAEKHKAFFYEKIKKAMVRTFSLVKGGKRRVVFLAKQLTHQEIEDYKKQHNIVN